MPSLQSGKKMEFTVLFLCVLVVMAASWWGSHRLALALFSIVLVASVATYLHHATDTLNLSF
jgi:general stress protein CsbA